MPSLSKQKSKRTKKSINKLSPYLNINNSQTNRTSFQKESISSKQQKSPIIFKKFQNKHEILSKDDFPSRINRIQTLHSKQRSKNTTFNSTINNTKYLFEDKQKTTTNLRMINQKIQQKKQELYKLESRIIIQQQTLKLSQLKTKSFQNIYNTKMSQIIQGRKQVEKMAVQLEQKLKYIQIQSQKIQIKSKTIIKQTQQLNIFKQQLSLRKQSHEKVQKQLQLTIRQLENKSLNIQSREDQIQKIRVEQFSKQIELKTRQTYMNNYFKDLNSCISKLKEQRNNFQNIAVDLGQKCEQLQGIQIKIWKQIMTHMKQLGSFNPKSSRVSKQNKESKKWITIDSVNQDFTTDQLMRYR